MIEFLRDPHPERTFSPEEHEWLARYNGLYLFVMKSTDRWTPFRVSKLRDYIPTPREDVPVHIRRKAGRRLGGARRWW